MLTRRTLLGGSFGLAGALALSAGAIGRERALDSEAVLPRRPAPTGGQVHDINIVAREHAGGDLVPAARKAPLWLYNDTLFPIVRIRQGDRLRATLHNELSEHTAIHWHGIRLLNPMDGVQYVTQPPVQPGASFTYDFTPPDTGTFFFHSHCNSATQLGRGLLGVLIVEGDEQAPFHDEQVLVVKDWRLGEDGHWLPFETAEGAGHAGTFGTVRTTNGQENWRGEVPAHGDIRLRVMNLDPTRMMQIGIEGAQAFVIATDGNPIAPVPLETWTLGAAMRVDLVVRAPAAGKSFRVLDYFSAEPWPVAVLRSTDKGLRPRPFAPLPLFAADIPEPDLASAQRLPFQFSAAAGSGTAISVLAPDDPFAAVLLDSLCTGDRGLWAINKTQWPTDGHRQLPPPLASLDAGRSYVLELMNATPHPHPIHLHGHTFRVLSASRQDLPHFLADTVLLQPKERIQIAFVAAPGNWMFHCHILEHQDHGMMGWLRVA